MILRQRNRAQLSSEGCDCCNVSMSPHYIKRHRRTVKRRERAAWKKEN